MRSLFFYLCLALVLASCKQDAASTDTPPATPPPPAEETPTAETTLQPIENPLLSTREGQLLIRNFWVFEFYIIPNDHEASVKNRGRWYTFNADGTFESGHWEEQTSKGTWYLYNDGKYKVRLDAIDDAEDAEWELQFAGDGDVASWIGTSAFIGNKGVMSKVINLMTRPTKKQFGYE